MKVYAASHRDTEGWYPLTLWVEQWMAEEEVARLGETYPEDELKVDEYEVHAKLPRVVH